MLPSSGFVRLAPGVFYFAIRNLTFYEIVKFISSESAAKIFNAITSLNPGKRSITWNLGSSNHVGFYFSRQEGTKKEKTKTVRA
jgi:hypothetical protein